MTFKGVGSIFIFTVNFNLYQIFHFANEMSSLFVQMNLSLMNDTYNTYKSIHKSFFIQQNKISVFFLLLKISIDKRD